MTRAEFINTIDSWPELLGFCHVHDCPVCADVHNTYERDQIVRENIMEWAHDMTWQDICDILMDIPLHGNIFLYNDNGYWNDITEDFTEWKDKVILWGNQTGFWASELTPAPASDPDTPLTLLFP